MIGASEPRPLWVAYRIREAGQGQLTASLLIIMFDWLANNYGGTMAKRQKPLSEQLRKLIEESELSRYEIGKRSGVDASQLHRFVNGTGRLTTDSLDKIGEVLQLRLVQGK